MPQITFTTSATIFDLLLGIGFIALGISGMVTLVFIEIFHFRKKT